MEAILFVLATGIIASAAVVVIDLWHGYQIRGMPRRRRTLR